MPDLWLILDVETTGLDPATAGVWQIGAVLWQEGREVETFELLVQPEPRHWTPEHVGAARRLSALTSAEEAWLCAEALPLAETLLCLVDLLIRRDKQPIIAVSYNLAFEQGFIERGRAALSRLAGECGIDFRWGPCLMAAAVQALAPERERLSLRKACERLGIPWSGSHRALADARLAARVGERLGVFTREEE